MTSDEAGLAGHTPFATTGANRPAPMSLIALNRAGWRPQDGTLLARL